MRRQESVRGEEVKRSVELRRAPTPQVDLAPGLAGVPGLRAPELDALPPPRLRAMLMAGVEILECRRVLEHGGINLVSEVLRGHGDFVEYEHYPRDDVYDSESGAQYYYHAHRGEHGEHGHFHTFLRHAGSSWNCLSGAVDVSEKAADGAAVTHLIAVSMDAYGWPMGLFATNHWVCGGAWLPAEAVIGLLPRFRIDHAYPSWPVNRWINAMLILFRPHVEALLRHRDSIITARRATHSAVDVLEDRALEITGFLPIDVEETLQTVRDRLRTWD